MSKQVFNWTAKRSGPRMTVFGMTHDSLTGDIVDVRITGVREIAKRHDVPSCTATDDRGQTWELI